MKNKIKIVFFILLSLYSAYFFICSTLAPIMAHYHYYEFSAKLTSLFMYSCHQQPDRSFWLLGYPVALCCRCYGVYLATMISSILAILEKLKIHKYIICLFVLITLTDICINYGFGIRTYNTGNVTRFVVGIIMGILFTIGINGIFNTRRRN